MKLPKTYWNKLSEEAKETFATFYREVEFSELRFWRAECPGLWRRGTVPLTDCRDLCSVLFGRVLGVQRFPAKCPCTLFGDAAVEALRQCLVKDGWLPEEEDND